MQVDPSGDVVSPATTERSRGGRPMRVPPSLLLVPLLLAGMYLPAAGSEPIKPAAGVLGMEHLTFSEKSVTLKCGQTLTMRNSSRWVHLIGPGKDGRFDENGDPGVPI